MQAVNIRIINFLKKIDKTTTFIAIVLSLAVLYFVNPLINIELTAWNRTFCSASLAGVSIDKRVANFYKLFFVYIPVIFTFILCICNWLLSHRPVYKDYITKFSIMGLFPIVTGYISRFSPVENVINENILLQSIVLYLVILLIVAVIDYSEMFTFSDITTLFLAFATSVVSSNILLRTEVHISILVSGGLVLIYSILMSFTAFGRQVHSILKNVIYFLMWIPVVIWINLEILYYFNEKGWKFAHYYTCIGIISFMFAGLAGIISLILRAKKLEKDFLQLGYIGAVISMGVMAYLPYSYQRIVSYVNFSNLYEMGNETVAMDTVMYGKLPIIDYFSAHAMKDVWTRILYCVLHEDAKGVFGNPYGGMSEILGFLILFFIVEQLFDKDIAVLFVCLFPGIVTGIKFTSICCISIAMLIYIIKNPGTRQFVLFWCSALIGAFFVYDEGISLGIACILAYVVASCIMREWRHLKVYIASGILTGIGTLIIYVIYGVATGLPIVSRLKEWISVSVGSNSTWATVEFGDVSSFAFLLSYFVAPVVAVVILFMTIYRYYIVRENIIYAVITIAFAFTEILYVTRTIVYHNLAVCSGITGVLLNFIHWTVSSYVLYLMLSQKRQENSKTFLWGGAIFLVIIMEGALVTHYLPDSNSSLLARSITASDNWELTNDMTENWHQERIVYDDETTLLINQFRNIFDTLLDDDETFLDFANITSMYAFTGRERPCYVGQSPSLLTDLYSQECFLKEVAEYNCPLTVVGTTGTNYLTQMIGIPHNIRYYRIAEYIYNKYRPLIGFGEFAIWCEKECYDDYYAKLAQYDFEGMGYTFIDYGYDATTAYIDEQGNQQYTYMPFHSYELGMIPYIWANYDDYCAIENEEIISINAQAAYQYTFEGSQNVMCEEGNYLVFECTNNTDKDIMIGVDFQDSLYEGIRFQYSLTVLPGSNQYMIRTSGDYFWDVFNIDNITYYGDADYTVHNVRILKGD